MTLTNKQYKQINDLQRAEFLVSIRESKINILSKFFLQSDELLTKIERMPSIKNRDAFNKEIGRLEMTMEDFNEPMSGTLLGETANTVQLGAYHNDQTITLGTGKPYNTPLSTIIESVEKLRVPYSKDIEVLKKAGVFIAPNEVITIPMPEWGTERVIQGDLRFNRMLEIISARTDLTQEEKDKLYKALGNYADSGTPIGTTVRENIINFMGVQPSIELKLSDSIWGADKRDAIIQKVIDDANKGISPNDTKNELAKSLKESGVGGSYYKAERVVDTTLQNAYTQAKVDSSRAYNEGQDIEALQLVFVRELSHFHSVRDICDEMAGVYELNSGVPMGALHPNDMCKVYTKYRADVKKNKVRDLGNSYTSKTTKKTLNLI